MGENIGHHTQLPKAIFMDNFVVKYFYAFIMMILACKPNTKL